MHRRLRAYFARKGCGSPDDLADETLTRAARRLEEEGGITDVTPARFCYITARFVFLEYLRSPDRGRTALPRDVRDPLAGSDDDARERDLACLEDVLDFYERRFHIGLTPQERADLLAFLRAL